MASFGFPDLLVYEHFLKITNFYLFLPGPFNRPGSGLLNYSFLPGLSMLKAHLHMADNSPSMKHSKQEFISQIFSVNILLESCQNI